MKNHDFSALNIKLANLSKNFFDYFVHSLFLDDNRLDKLHLRTGAVEIMVFAVDLVVDVTCEIVGKEPDKMLESD